MPNTVRLPQAAVEADRRLARQRGQLAAPLTRQIHAVARGPESRSRQPASVALRFHHGRLLGMSRLHHALGLKPDKDDVDLSEVLTRPLRKFDASGVFENPLSLTSTLARQCRVDPSHASAVMMAFSEIVSNAMKYAHPTGLPVEMIVIARPASDGTISLIIADDGVGLPELFAEARDAGGGLKLVRSLMESIGGRLTMSSNELGLRFQSNFPGRATAGQW